MSDPLFPGLPLNGGQLQNIPGSASLNEAIVILNDIINDLNAKLETEVLSDTTSKRYLSGYQKSGWPAGDFGIKVSPVGIDVTTCAFNNLLYAQDFTTGAQYYNVGGSTLLEIGPASDGSVGLSLLNGSLAGLFIGKDGGGNIITKIAKTGHDARTATNDQLIFNSNQDTLKVVASGTTSITPPSSWASGNSQTVAIPHGLNITPAFLVYVSNPTVPGVLYSPNLTLTPSVMWGGSAAGGVGFFCSLARADATNLYIDLTNLLSTTQTGLDVYTWNYKYYILQETAT